MIIVHSIWLKEVKWFGPSNPSTLFQHNLTTYATPKFVLDQCDQIGRFIALWINFQRLWQQLFCPNKHHLNAIFWKVSKLFISKWNNFWATFIDIWQLFTGHTVHETGFADQRLESLNEMDLLTSSAKSDAIFDVSNSRKISTRFAWLKFPTRTKLKCADGLLMDCMWQSYFICYTLSRL